MARVLDVRMPEHRTKKGLIWSLCARVGAEVQSANSVCTKDSRRKEESVDQALYYALRLPSLIPLHTA